MDYHDVLAKVGAGSAHPGGFGATERWIRQVRLNDTSRVLDVGCGTGRTLMELANQFGCHVAGIDVRRSMIQKAQQRARHACVKGVWRVGSAEKLPFRDQEFDLVITESVNVFIDVKRALKEYRRVLKPDGTYVDVEMMVTGPPSPYMYESARAMYGAKQVPDLRGWKTLYGDAGFSRVEVCEMVPVRPTDSLVMENQYPDLLDLADANAYQDPEVVRVLRENSQWLDVNHGWLSYGIFICHP